MEFKDRAAIVTGGGTGLGRSVALALARAGCHVAVNYPGADEAEAQATSADARALGVQALAVRADVTRAEEVAVLIAEAQAALGRLDILVNNAGATVFVPFPDLDALSEADWDRIMAVNVKGAFLCARAAAPAMRASGGGRIVNVASISGLRPGGSSIPYSVSKSALLGLTRCLALALAPDILVNAVAPGTMPTRWGLLLGEDANTAYVARTLTGRLIETDEVAQAVLALLGNDSITGETLTVDGGVLIH
jgi:3-oxoacyl-[acyl-carrier protein] reductase